MARLRKEDVVRRQASGQGGDFLELLARSIRVMEMMGVGRAAHSISDVSRITGLPRPSVRRILHTLRDLGYAEMAGRDFRLTPKVVRLATSFLGASGHARTLQAACDRLSGETGQSALIAVLDEDEILVVAYAMPDELMAPFRGIGARMPAALTAAGRVLLAALPDPELTSFIRRLADNPPAGMAPRGAREIEAAILEARVQGYSISDDEYVMGWKTFACPLHRFDGGLYGAMSLNCKKVAGFDDAQFQALAQRCLRASQELTPQLV